MVIKSLSIFKIYTLMAIKKPPPIILTRAIRLDVLSGYLTGELEGDFIISIILSKDI